MGEGEGVVAGRTDRSPTLGQLAKAKAQAQAKFTPLGKDKTADIATRTGGKYSYAYADLATCLEAVIPALSEVGIALFQPVRIEEARAIATTLLVHESNEFLSSDFAVGIVDPSDARSVGSAATYARRYGLLSMLGYASGDGEDDDGEAARGGQHEQAAAKSEPACPACGVVGSIMKGAAQYGGGILCWVKRGGCGVKWPEGTPFPPTEKPPLDPDPAPGPRRAKAGQAAPAARRQASGQLAVAPPEAIAAMVDEYREALALNTNRGPGIDSVLPETRGSEDCETKGCWGPKGHEFPHVFEPNPKSAQTSDAPPVTRFQIGKSLIETAGMTQAQFEQSVLLSTEIDRGPLGKGYARTILGKILGKPADQSTRKELTEEKATKYLAALKQAAAGGGDGQAESGS